MIVVFSKIVVQLCKIMCSCIKLVDFLVPLILNFYSRHLVLSITIPRRIKLRSSVTHFCTCFLVKNIKPHGTIRFIFGLCSWSFTSVRFFVMLWNKPNLTIDSCGFSNVVHVIKYYYTNIISIVRCVTVDVRVFNQTYMIVWIFS